MASVNTSSIREEITHVKAQLDEQVCSGKVTDETRVLISSLLVTVDLLIAIFLEKSTKKGNKNSSIPSSQTDEDNSSKLRKKPTRRAEHEEAYDDSNGYVDDVHGINTITGSGDPMDDNAHGTHVSGTIGGTANNSQGVAGVNCNVSIMGIKFLDAEGSGSTSDAIAGLEYVLTMKQAGSRAIGLFQKPGVTI